MVASVASFGSPTPAQGQVLRPVGAWRVAPTPAAPDLQDQPRPATPQTSASGVALAPAAMTALIEAQERLSQDAPPVVLQHTAHEIDQLIYRLDGGGAAARAEADMPLTVRRLQTARDALSRSLVDLQA